MNIKKMIFKYTSKNKNDWRGWLKDGQTVEFCWNKYGWTFGVNITIHDNDSGGGHRLLNLNFWKYSLWLPLGITEYPWDPMEGPRWSIDISSEFGLHLNWGHKNKYIPLPWHSHTFSYEKQLLPNDDNSWITVFDYTKEPYTEKYPYTYVLENGVVQSRTATVSKRRHILTWQIFRLLGWPRWIRESIDIEFSDEVGEKSGSWKGGCTGCSYELNKNETMEQCLRRMESERKF